MGHISVTIPLVSDKPRFYPAQKGKDGEWIGVADDLLSGMAGFEYYQNVSGARAAAGELIQGGTQIDAIIYVSVTGRTVLKLEGDSREANFKPAIDAGCSHPDFGSW